MDRTVLIELMRATFDPNKRKQAEEDLEQLHELKGFAPTLLQVVMSNDVPMPVRQASAVYLKNMVSKAWYELEEGLVSPYNISEQDRALIRDIIVESVVLAPDILRIQLCLTLKSIIKCDFPYRWTKLVDKINTFLQNPYPSHWMGALLCLYHLIKNYEYNSADKRGPLIETMNLLLPVIYRKMITLHNDQSAESVLIKKQILKCHFALIKYTLSLELHSKEVFMKWMEILCLILEQPIPEHTYMVDEYERTELPWWKIKKWSIHTLFRIFERYGSPITSRDEYADFSLWYLITFTGGILKVLLHILDQFRNKVYVSPRILQQTLVYIDHCVSHSYSWKLLKPHMLGVIREVLFPMLSFTAVDLDLWNTDPQEYIRIKFDIFEDIVSPIIAAQNLLTSACRKRKDMLESTMTLCMQVLSAPNADPSQRDGAFHMIGTLHNVLMKHPSFKKHICILLEQLVLPEFQSPRGHMRARVCWVVQCFSNIRFKNDNLLLQAVQLSINALLHDVDLPVKVEAAIAIQMLLTSQEKVHGYLEPHVKEVTTELLKVIRKTENDNIANVLQKMFPMYSVQLQPMAIEITDHIANTFSRVVETEVGSDEKAITAMGLLNTLETVISALDTSPEIMADIEKTVFCVVAHILDNHIIEYYEEALGLLRNLSAKHISQNMWRVLETLYQLFQKEGFDYFKDMVPILHNYITVDTSAFLSNENNMLAIFNMIKAVLAKASEDESELYAAKLLEVIVLQCSGRIDNCLPVIVELVLNRLVKKVKSTDLRLMLMQVLISMFYCNPAGLFALLNNMQQAFPNAGIEQSFIKQWISDSFGYLGIHDRRLCILAICTLLDMGASRPSIDEVIPIVIPCCMLLLDGLKRAYELQAGKEHVASSSSVGMDNLDDTDILSSDEDDFEDMSNDYLENLSRKAVAHASSQTDEPYPLDHEVQAYAQGEYEIEYNLEVTPLECYSTPLDNKNCLIDEFVVFKDTMQGLSLKEPDLYGKLMSYINDMQYHRLKALYILADQRKASQCSKMIERQGGYCFTVPASVPTKFKFGP